MKSLSICSLCGEQFQGMGHNPEPLKPFDERCCTTCNDTKVIPARIAGFNPPPARRETATMTGPRIEVLPRMEYDEDGYERSLDPCDEWSCALCGIPVGVHLVSEEDEWGREREGAVWAPFWIDPSEPEQRYCEDHKDEHE